VFSNAGAIFYVNAHAMLKSEVNNPLSKGELIRTTGGEWNRLDKTLLLAFVPQASLLLVLFRVPLGRLMRMFPSCGRPNTTIKRIIMLYNPRLASIRPSNNLDMSLHG